MLIEIILFTSVILQIVAAFLALRMIKITEGRVAWILITIGLILMATRRSIHILPYLGQEITPQIELINEWLAFFISLVMFAGIALIAPVFYAVKRSEKNLQESEERYRTLVENVNIGVYRSSADIPGRFLHANIAMARLLGYESLDEFLRVPVSSLYKDPERRKEFLEKIRRDISVRNQEVEMVKRNGTPMIASVTARAKFDEKGEIQWIDGVLEDITERKEIENKIRESEQTLYRVIQGSPIPTFVIGKNHRILYWNKALEELTKIKAEDVLGTTQQWRAFYSEERPCMADLLVDGALGDIPRWYEGIYTKSKLIEEAFEATDFFPALGEEGKWLRFTAAVIRGYSGEVVGAIETLEDITERKKAENELITMKKLESLGIFARGIAHDFSHLLSTMLRNIFSAKMSLTEEDKALVGELEIAEKVGLQAKELAYRLIAFAKGEEPTRKVSSIAQLLRETADLTLSETNVMCKFLLPDDLWSVDIDEVQMRQVVDNLLINAREAMPGGGRVIIRAENVDISSGSPLPLKEGKYVRWSVKDHGKGIPKEDLPRIFDPYFTTKQSGTPKGVGLGLAICYSIVAKHNGFISVESEPDVGTTFIIYLPAALESKREDEALEISVHKGRILVMNDEENVRDATGVVLNYLGYVVDFAKDGVEAIDLYKKAKESKRPFSAVILDLEVPGGMGGKETIKELLKIDPSVKAIISCGYADDPVVSEFRDYGFSDVVNVSYDMDTMKEKLARLLEQ